MTKKIVLFFIIALSVSTMNSQNDQDVLTRDQVITDDLIVNGGSLAVGQDASNGESFGSDTFRLKENNLRIHFDDTSASANFPGNDWRIGINSSDNGGDNYFSVEDATAGNTPFRIMAGAGANALHVDDSGGNIGMGTNTPVVELHIADGDSPAIRIEQNGSNGFTPQAWDLAGNETNFFVRDVTNGSLLPFKIEPNAATNTLVIDASDGVGIGTQEVNVNASLHLNSATKGLLLNRHTTDQRTTLGGNLEAAQSGMIVYDTEENFLYVWDGTAWVNASLDLSSSLSDLESRVLELENSTGADTGTVPELLNYQTVVRDNTGAVIQAQNISFRISVLQASSTGAAVYTETHQVTTSDYGVANFTIGSGNVVSGDFSAISWGRDNHYLQVELDVDGGTNYSLIGATQFVSVPYALRAKTADVVRSFEGSGRISENTSELNILKEQNEVLRREIEMLNSKLNAVLEKVNRN